MILASPSSCRIITAGIPRLAWRILSWARSSRRRNPTVSAITRTRPVASRCTGSGRQRSAILHSPSPSQSMHVERGERVVDGRRERADGYLDELIDREGEILGERAVRARGMRAAERAGDTRRGGRRPHVGQRLALGDEVPGTVQQTDDRVAASGRCRSACPCARTAGSRCRARARRRCPRPGASAARPATGRPSARGRPVARRRRRSRAKGRRRSTRSPAGAGSTWRCGR